MSDIEKDEQGKPEEAKDEDNATVSSSEEVKPEAEFTTNDGENVQTVDPDPSEVVKNEEGVSDEEVAEDAENVAVEPDIKSLLDKIDALTDEIAKLKSQQEDKKPGGFFEPVDDDKVEPEVLNLDTLYTKQKIYKRR